MYCSLSSLVLFPNICYSGPTLMVPLYLLVPPPQPMEIYVDDETKLTLHGLQQHYVKLAENAKNRKLTDLLDALEFNQVGSRFSQFSPPRALDELFPPPLWCCTSLPECAGAAWRVYTTARCCGDPAEVRVPLVLG